MAERSLPPVPLVDLAAEYAEVGEAVRAAVDRVFASQRFVLGPEVEAFEQELAAFCGVAHAVGVSSGTDALLVSLMALGVGPGDEVITTAFSFIATAEVIVRLGAKPVFCDIDPRSFNLDPRAVTAALGPRTRAVLPVHLFGRVAALPDGLPAPVLGDAAQAIGAPLPAGQGACLSFYPTKNLGAAGDGGAVLTDDADFADRLRLLRQHGSRPRYRHAVTGGNFRLDAIQAAVLRAKLPFLRAWNARRQAAAARYRALFDAAGLDAIALPEHAPGHVYNQFVIQAERRDALRQALAAQNIGAEVYYPHTLPAQGCFAALGHRDGEFPAAEALAARALALPMGPWLQPEQQLRVVEAIAAFFGR